MPLNWGQDGGTPFSAAESTQLEGELRIRNPCPQVQQLVLGGGSLGCLFQDVSAEAAKGCIERAVEIGIHHIDTSPWYGAGLSESRIGEALAGRRDVVVSTKCGRIVVPKADLSTQEPHRVETCYDGHFYTDKYHMNRACWTYTGDGIRESVRQSCARLGFDTIDCLRLHDAENKERFEEATQPGGAIDTMIALKSEGKVREISLGMNSADYILAILRLYPGKFDTIMYSNSFNIIDHSCLIVLMECQKQGIKVTVAGVFCSGYLWGGAHYMYDSKIPNHVKEKVDKWRTLSAKHGLTLPQVALNFAFLPETVDFVAFGASSADEVDANAALCGKIVPLALWKEAKETGLIDMRLPLPECAEPAQTSSMKRALSESASDLAPAKRKLSIVD